MSQQTRQQKLAMLIKKRKQCERVAHEIVKRLIEEKVEKDYLLEKAGLISPHHWDDIIEERKLGKLCGWVLCDQQISIELMQKYVIKNNTVLDISERKNFCSSHCYAASSHFKDQLRNTPLWLREEEDVPEFKLLQDDHEAAAAELHGIKVNLHVSS